MATTISDEGEILLKGPTITRGYYKRDDVNATAFDADGFFHTGDAGYLRDGELFLTERIKDLYKTSNGKYIAPQMVEAMLLVDKYIDQVAVIAASLRNGLATAALSSRVVRNCVRISRFMI